MVQVIGPTAPNPSAAAMIGNALGTGLGKNFIDPQQLLQRQLLQKSLEEAKTSINKPGATQLERMIEFMKAGAGIPGSERYMGQLLPLVQQITAAENAQKAPFGQQEGQVQTQQPIENLELNDYLTPKQENPFFPSNVGAQQETGNLPQEATTGIKEPIASTQQLLKMSKPYAAQKTAAGMPTTPQEAFEELKAINEDRKIHNKEIDAELGKRIASQREYGRLAQEKLNEVMPNAGSEETAYIKRKVEELAGQNKSEADIERLAAGEARKYKNLISQISNDIPAQRVQNRPVMKLLGTSKSEEQARNDLRVKLKPLLDAGLYDKARSILSERGYMPEEREMIISNLGENALKTMSQMPSLQPREGAFQRAANKALFKENTYDPEQIQSFKQNLQDVLTKDPSTNLILLRRKYEDEKGVDWRMFKDSLNDLIDQGVFTPNDDQFNMLNKLDQPALNNLDQLLYNVGLIGR